MYARNRNVYYQLNYWYRGTINYGSFKRIALETRT